MMQEENRTCSKCSKEKPLTKEYFYMSKGYFYHYCKECSYTYVPKGRKIKKLPVSEDGICQCYSCLKHKSFNEENFLKNNGVLSGLCKECSSERLRELAKIKKEKLLLQLQDGTLEDKCCSGCGKTLPATLEHFHINNGALMAKCKKCVNDSNLEYNISKREERRLYAKTYREINREKIKGTSFRELL